MRKFLLAFAALLFALPAFADPPASGLSFIDDIFALPQQQNFGGTGGGLAFVASLPATCTPGTTASVQLSVSAYTINYCSATNTWTALSGGAGTVTSVTGTVNQIDVATGTTTPALTLDAAIILPGSLTAPTGGSITVSGTGTNNATALNGTAFTGTSTHIVAFGAANIPVDSGIVDTAAGLLSACTGCAPLVSPSFTTPALGTPSSGTLTNATGLPLSGVVSATGAIATIADGDNPLIINCALTSGTTCLTTGETTAASTAGAVEHQITTLTTSTAIPLQLTQGVNGPAAANAPAVIKVSAAAAGGVAAATGGGFIGAPITLATGAGSAAGATSGTGGTGGAYSLTTGNGGAGSATTGNGGIGGAWGITTGTGGAAGGNTANAGGAGGAINMTSGAGIVGKATGAGGAGGSYTFLGGVGGAGGATSGTGGAGGSFTLTAGTGGAATAGSTTGAGGNINLNPGVPGATGTAGAFGKVLLTLPGLITTNTDGMEMVNTTTSTAGVPAQYSPGLHFQNHVWNTTGPADWCTDWNIFNVPTSQAGPYGTLHFKVQTSASCGAAVADAMSLDQFGDLGLAGTFNATAMKNTANGHLLISFTAPTISSGFGSGPSIVANNGPSAFTVNVGTGGAASAGVIGLPTATTGWACHVAPNGAPQAAAVTYSAPTSASSVTLTNYTLTTGATLAWTASLVFQISCFGY